MTLQTFLDYCLGSFNRITVDEMAEVVYRERAHGYLFEWMIGYEKMALANEEKERIAFRGAYLMERLYFIDEHSFCVYVKQFERLFLQTDNESAKRHYAKIMTHILHPPGLINDEEAVAERCVDWILKPRTRVAVRIWAMEALISMARRVEWLPEVLNNLLIQFETEESPAIQVRVKRWRKYDWAM